MKVDQFLILAGLHSASIIHSVCCCIIDGYYYYMVDGHFLFCKIMVCTACKSEAYFVLSPRLSVTDTVCFNFHFSVSRPVMGGI